ncbi:hypothetical protein JOF56_005717 [Kibdelosporangium banguiense]|uniref:DUF2190 family protein n=1 Tax=Kibdelosporangium banguiense TaxID=1365924 RepID=A0ABS4TLP6_9PSEU|nr:hypothetical protein [Kibdelosporangium banguiense]MBP2325332.1 hypothetical protein [Kibdelosporangium banguiense]
MPIIDNTGKVLGGVGLGRLKPVAAVYDFAVDGGAVGDIPLRGDAVPAGAIIVDALLHVDGALVSANGTAALRAEAAGDIQTAAAATAAPWNGTGPKRASLTATSPPVKTTARRPIVLSIGTAALTAGRFTVVLWVVEL